MLLLGKNFLLYFPDVLYHKYSVGIFFYSVSGIETAVEVFYCKRLYFFFGRRLFG